MPVASAVQSFTYDELMFWARAQAEGYGYDLADWFEACSRYGVGEEEALLDYLRSSGSPLDVTKNADGSYTGWFSGATEQVVQTNPINSNATTVSRGNLRQMVGQKFEDVQGTLTRNMTKYPASGGLGQKASYVLGSVGSAFAAVSTGIWLGKTVDSLLYNANPDYWDSIGLSTLDPEKWNGIVNDDNSPFAGMFNFIMGLDPESGEAQMYMNQNALAYMGYALNQNGWFSSGEVTPVIDPAVTPELQITGYAGFDDNFAVLFPMWAGAYNNPITKYDWTYQQIVDVVKARVPNINDYVCFMKATQTSLDIYLHEIGLNVITYSSSSGIGLRHANRELIISPNNSHLPYVYRDYTSNIVTEIRNEFNGVYTGYYYWSGRLETVAVNPINATIEPTVPGVGNQDGATLPNTSDWSDVASTLESLKEQYPDAFDNAMVWDEYNDDGTPNQSVWIPVPMPTATYGNDTQPVSGDQTQTSTDISQIAKALSDTLTKIVQETKPQTQPQPQPDIPPQNPVNTGTGATPTPTPPIGSASALWSVYHPTQTQVDSFGAWLWTDNVITKIQQVLENPMEGIITLHKVFAPPVDAGTGTIVVGRLDSEVPSETVNQQYVTVDCGSINCYEYFGNVFDYDPYTRISLYLPFIGIVPLNTSDVMRSTINVKYGVDVYTGACLATVEVSRDANTICLYQYSGVCSVEYPLTGAVHSGLINGLLGVAGGVAGIAMASTGVGAVAGATSIAGGLASATKANNARASSFSGNSGAMGIKKPYLIIERPQTKVADTFPQLAGYPTNYSCTLGDCEGQVNVKSVHVAGINATDKELSQIESLLKSGVIV